MKKRLTDLISIIAVLLCALALYACANNNEPPHVHAYGAWTSNDEYTHTRVCDCGSVATENHVFSGDECALCGFVKASETPDPPDNPNPPDPPDDPDPPDPPDDEKLDYDMSGVTFENAEYDYDGREHVLEITGALPDGVTVSYTENALTNAGELLVTASFSGDENHNDIPEMTATLTVNKIDYDMAGIVFDGMTCDYDGGVKRLEIAGELPDGVTVTYDNNDKVNAGTYTVTASFSGDENHNGIPEMTATLTVNKIDYDMSGVTFEDATYSYDGIAKILEVTGTLPNGLKIVYSPNLLLGEGELTVTAAFVADGNHNAVAPMIATLKVVRDGKYHDAVFLLSDNKAVLRVVKHGEGVTDIPDVPNKDGYTAVWNAELSAVTEDITVKPAYTPIVYTVTYECGVGANSPENPVEYTVESPIISLKDATYKVGYDFDGWYTTNDFQVGSKVDSIETGTIGNITLYAKFAPEKYTVMYIYADRIVKAETVEYGAEYTFLDHAPLPDYEVMEWTDENGNKYAPGATTEYTYLQGMTLSGKAAYAGSDFECGVADGTATITKYVGTATDVVIPEYIKHEAAYYTVTAIGDRAFGYNDIVESVIISKSVTSIGNNGFYYCSALKNINIPNSVTSIGNLAFFACASLTSIIIPSSVVSIGSRLFFNCAALESVKIEGNLKSIDKYTFWQCCNLSDITLPESLTSISDSTFYMCDSLVNITIPSGVSSIGSKAFYRCIGLESIAIPDSVISIGSDAFYGCSNLANVVLGSGIERIDDQAFFSCEKLKSIAIPSSVTYIGKSVYENCSYIESITVNSANTVYHSAGNCLIETETKTLVVGCKNSIIPADGSVTVIGSDAFDGCIVLNNIIIPDSVTTIGSSAFNGCTNLTNIVIPDSVTTIGSSAFANCESLENVVMSNNIVFVGYRSFCRTSISNIILPDSLETIDDGAFDYCYKLTSIYIPSNVSRIGESAFANCSLLVDITVDSENPVYHSAGNCIIETATKTLVAGCKNSVIPDDGSVAVIGERAFYGSGLKNIIIPSSVKTIGNYAFEACLDLINVVISDGVTSIGACAFDSCRSLTNIVIPNGVTSIGNSAFRDCDSIVSIVIPNSVTSIGKSLFDWTYKLSAVYYKGTAEEWSNISIGTDNDELDAATKYFYSETNPYLDDPADTNRYWHYVDDEIVVWSR